MDKYSYNYEILSFGRPITKYLEFEKSEEGINILVEDSELEKRCLLKKQKYKTFNKAIGEPANSDVIEAIQKAIKNGNVKQVEEAVSEHAKTVFSWIDSGFIDRITDRFN